MSKSRQRWLAANSYPCRACNKNRVHRGGEVITAGLCKSCYSDEFFPWAVAERRAALAADPTLEAKFSSERLMGNQQAVDEWLAKGRPTLAWRPVPKLSQDQRLALLLGQIQETP